MAISLLVIVSIVTLVVLLAVTIAASNAQKPAMPNARWFRQYHPTTSDNPDSFLILPGITCGDTVQCS